MNYTQYCQIKGLLKQLRSKYYIFNDSKNTPNDVPLIESSEKQHSEEQSSLIFEDMQVIQKQVKTLSETIHLKDKHLEEANKEIASLKEKLEEEGQGFQALQLKYDEIHNQNIDLQSQIENLNKEINKQSNELSVAKLSNGKGLADSDYAKAFWLIAYRYLRDAKSKDTTIRSERKKNVNDILNNLKLDTYLSKEQRYFINQIDDKNACFAIEEIETLLRVEDFKREHEIAKYIIADDDSQMLKVYDWLKKKLAGKNGAKEQILPIKAAVAAGLLNENIGWDVCRKEYGINFSESTWKNWMKGQHGYRYDDSTLDDMVSELKKYLGIID